MKDEAPIKPLQTKSKTPFLAAGIIFIIVIGLGIGFFVSKSKSSGSKVQNSTNVTVSDTEAGVKDIKVLTDKGINIKDATGVLQTGGIKGEGKYNLQRDGGLTQQVALNSTTVDMMPFVGKKVQVWGDTQASHYAPWLMDVVKIKVVQ